MISHVLKTYDQSQCYHVIILQTLLHLRKIHKLFNFKMQHFDVTIKTP